MNNIQILIFSLKIIYIILLIIVKINKYFSKSSPLFIIFHDILIFIMSIYIIVICSLSIKGSSIIIDNHDYLIIFIIALILILDINYKEFINSFSEIKKKGIFP